MEDISSSLEKNKEPRNCNSGPGQACALAEVTGAGQGRAGIQLQPPTPAPRLALSQLFILSLKPSEDKFSYIPSRQSAGVEVASWWEVGWA